MSLISTAAMGGVISFSGQLPLGRLSVTAAQISIQDGAKKAWLFSLGIAVTEIICMRIGLTTVNWVLAHRTFLHVINWLIVVLFFVLGTSLLLRAGKKKKEIKALPHSAGNGFLLGVLTDFATPLQAPYWFGWSVTLVKTKLLIPESDYYNFFTMGVGAGTLAGLVVYVYNGKWLIKRMDGNRTVVSRIAGILFLITACTQLYKSLFRPM